MRLFSALVLLFLLGTVPLVAADGEEKTGRSYQLLVLGLFLGFVLGALSSYSYLLHRKVSTEKSEEILITVPGLTESENKVFLALLKEEGRVYQDKLPLLSGLSRARVSEILTSLEKKGIVKKEGRGRTNLVTLKRDFRIRSK
jgi:uncharacterized membrane protein